MLFIEAAGVGELHQETTEELLSKMKLLETELTGLGMCVCVYKCACVDVCMHTYVRKCICVCATATSVL